MNSSEFVNGTFYLPDDTKVQWINATIYNNTKVNNETYTSMILKASNFSL